MRNTSVAILIALGLFTLSSCRKVVGTGPVVTETRQSKEFSAIEFSVPGNIRYVEGSEHRIDIEAQRNIIDVIETFVTGHELRVKVRDNVNIKRHEEVTITVTAPSVHALTLKGSGNLSVPGTFSTDAGLLRISGSGNIWVSKLETEDLEVEISGSGNVLVANGHTARAKVSISGSGEVDVVGVEARIVNTSTSGSGSTRVFATERLDARISGSGDVLYKGNPIVNANISGSGKVSKL